MVSRIRFLKDREAILLRVNVSTSGNTMAFVTPDAVSQNSIDAVGYSREFYIQ
jgi:hypothetical protein